MSIATMFDGWPRIQDRLVRRLPMLGADELAMKAAPDSWPVWALVAHIAMVRVYWLCVVCKEPGLETTPFEDPSNDGWEDHLDQPRSADELLVATESSWRLVESCLERWTPAMLGESFSRERARVVEHHTRSSVLTRLVMHDSFHCGEVSLVLGMNGWQSMDPWEPLS